MGFGCQATATPRPARPGAGDVRIGIWSTKGFVARWTAPAPAPVTVLDVDLQLVGTDRLAGTITNRLAVPLENTIVAFGNRVYYNVGTIAALCSIQID